MLPRNRLRQAATTAALVVATFPLTAAAAPPPLVRSLTSAGDAMAAALERAGGAAFVGGIAMVALLVVVGALAVASAARTLIGATTGPTPSSTSDCLDHGRDESGVELRSGEGLEPRPDAPAAAS